MYCPTRGGGAITLVLTVMVALRGEFRRQRTEGGDGMKPLLPTAGINIVQVYQMPVMFLLPKVKVTENKVRLMCTYSTSCYLHIFIENLIET